jgi:hypothetical protein
LPVVLCWCEACFVTLREGHRLRVFKNRVLRVFENRVLRVFENRVLRVFENRVLRVLENRLLRKIFVPKRDLSVLYCLSY